MKYTITQDSNYNYCINGVKINDKVFSEERVYYRIEDREDFIDTLIGWISETKGNDKDLMKDDLKMLMNIDDRYILSSISTNHYLFGNSEEFNQECENILKENESLI